MRRGLQAWRQGTVELMGSLCNVDFSSIQRIASTALRKFILTIIKFAKIIFIGIWRYKMTWKPLRVTKMWEIREYTTSFQTVWRPIFHLPFFVGKHTVCQLSDTPSGRTSLSDSYSMHTVFLLRWKIGRSYSNQTVGKMITWWITCMIARLTPQNECQQTVQMQS